MADLALHCLAGAAPGRYSQLDAAARIDFEHARSLSPAERLAELNDMLLLAEAFGPPSPSLEPIRCHDIRL